MTDPSETQLLKEQNDYCDKVKAIYDDWEKDLTENEQLCAELEKRIFNLKSLQGNEEEYHEKVAKLYENLKLKVEQKEKEVRQFLDPSQNSLLLLVKLENKQNELQKQSVN
ncbi:hypothetical protein TVAG_255240 [Trichomonas vaginalis G3]|uniref:Uncharacterized protein n=1 Tax=Trichomonas vaginalis (strain ATCC PRA-98 / G3) TaxID=412133 RepID=A2FPY4_TRIV3|nr:hypothetical protein TVAGG3_0089200 [Trichomonas vaginalis G3]EAX93043.1 hypothetical protein TVAG_255240 [Trichomonas vaginalis G3]KAI5543789.1 hypothetical protein TVAGG3_0089200 [Trichomonas vaginalis G3]|eukprot:XP_001305973.1 hypothetical protein [Trichomonas vaginalis G3]